MIEASAASDSEPEGTAAGRRRRLHLLQSQLRRAFGMAGAAVPTGGLPTGLAALDALLADGGLPRARLTLLSGAGATSLTHYLAAAVSQSSSLLWLDGAGDLFPAALAAAGADLAEIAIVRLATPQQLARAVAIALRSGGFDLVVVDRAALEPALAGRLSRLVRASREASGGRAPALLVQTQPLDWGAGSVADLLLHCRRQAWLEEPTQLVGQRLVIEVARQRGGLVGQSAQLDLPAPIPLPPLQEQSVAMTQLTTGRLPLVRVRQHGAS